mgnify:FL=1
MAKKFEFELNKAGVRELLLSNDMMKVCDKYANNAVSRLGDGYEASTYHGKNRVNASVIAVTDKARKENLETNSILKAVTG